MFGRSGFPLVSYPFVCRLPFSIHCFFLSFDSSCQLRYPRVVIIQDCLVFIFLMFFFPRFDNRSLIQTGSLAIVNVYNNSTQFLGRETFVMLSCKGKQSITIHKAMILAVRHCIYSFFRTLVHT